MQTSPNSLNLQLHGVKKKRVNKQKGLKYLGIFKKNAEHCGSKKGLDHQEALLDFLEKTSAGGVLWQPKAGNEYIMCPVHYINM